MSSLRERQPTSSLIGTEGRRKPVTFPYIPEKIPPQEALIGGISAIEGSRIPNRKLDAIIVPTVYVPTGLDESVRVSQIAQSQDVRPPVVYLCSGDATPKNVMDFLSTNGADTTNTIPIQLPQNFRIPDLQLGTDTFPVPGYTKRDLATKRNLGLALSRMLGWEHILFLDDDITGFDQFHLNLGLNGFDKQGRHVIAWRYSGDQSFVKHAYSRAGGLTEPSISGGASMVRVDDGIAFFPDIYNEDWLFFAAHIQSRNPFAVAKAGTLEQQVKDPFVTRSTAVEQEIGDTLAEGLFRTMLSDISLKTTAFDTSWWRYLSEERKRLLNNLWFRFNNTNDPTEQIRYGLSDAYLLHNGSLQNLLPEYIQAWLGDLPRWQDWYKNLPKGVSLSEACKRLDVIPVLAGS